MESRLKKTRRNLIWQFTYQILILALGMILPSIVIHTYGSEVNGLTSTAKQIITLVTLAKAGISTAVTYSLYKPVANNDRVKIAETLDAVNIVFNKVSLMILTVGLFVSVVFATVQQSTIPRIYVFIACYLLCINTAIDLRFTAAYNVFFSATQDKYIISIGLLIAGIVMYGLQILITVFRFPFILLYGCNIVGCALKICFFKTVFKKKYDPYQLKDNEEKSKNRTKLSGVGYATLNEIAHCVVTATQTFILSIFYGFAEASVYGVYLLVVDALCLIGQVVFTSFSPSFGSVVAEGNITKINKVFNIFQYSYFLLNTFLYMCATILFMPFVRVYTAGAIDINYANYTLMTGFIIYGMFYSYRVPYNITVSVVGAFKKAGIQTGITAIISVIVAIICARIDYSLVIVGPAVFYIVNTFYQHYMLKNEIRGFNNKSFWNHFVTSILCIGISGYIGIVLEKQYTPSSMIGWLIEACIVALLSLIFLIDVSYIIDRKCFKNTVTYFLGKYIK